MVPRLCSSDDWKGVRSYRDKYRSTRQRTEHVKSGWTSLAVRSVSRADEQIDTTDNLLRYGALKDFVKMILAVEQSRYVHSHKASGDGPSTYN